MITLSLSSANIANACFSVDSENMEYFAFDEIQKYKSFIESMKSIVADYIAYQNGIKPKHIPIELASQRKQITKIFKDEAKNAESVLRDFKLLTQLMDIFIEHRFDKNNFNEQQLFKDLNKLVSAQKDLDKCTCSASTFLTLVKENQRKYVANVDYPFIYFDKSLLDFLKPVVENYKDETDRYVRANTIQPGEQQVFHLLQASAYVNYIDSSFRQSGFLEMQTLMNQWHGSFQKFSRRFLSICKYFQFSEVNNSEPSIEQKPVLTHGRKKDAKKTRKPKLSISSTAPLQTNENVDASITTENSLNIDQSDKDADEVEDAIANKQNNLVDTTEEKTISLLQSPAIASEPSQEHEELRWWLGYELEKKLSAKKKRKASGLYTSLTSSSNSSSSSAVSTGSSSSQLELDEKEKINLILAAYNGSSSFELLCQILDPQHGFKLHELNWKTQVKPLLLNLGASINEKANGSRNKVILNGIKTVFHTHGTIGVDTINSHLKNYLLKALEKLLN